MTVTLAPAGRLSPLTAGVSVNVTVWPLMMVPAGLMDLPTVRSPPEITLKVSVLVLPPAAVADRLLPPRARPLTLKLKVPASPGLLPGLTVVQVSVCGVPAAPARTQPAGKGATISSRAGVDTVTVSLPAPDCRVYCTLPATTWPLPISVGTSTALMSSTAHAAGLTTRASRPRMQVFPCPRAGRGRSTSSPDTPARALARPVSCSMNPNKSCLPGMDPPAGWESPECPRAS